MSGVEIAVRIRTAGAPVAFRREHTGGCSPSTPASDLYVVFAVIVVGYLAVIKGGGILAEHWYDIDDPLTTTRGVVVHMWFPLGAAFLYTYAIIGVLRWWRPVLRDEHRTRRWVWTIPVVFAVCSLLAIDYGSLGDKTVGYVLALFVATQFVGWGEEGMFRGIGVTTLRAHGLREGQVALWSSLIFGAVHITNALSSGAQAIPQAIAVSFAGYFFYLTRRVSGTNLVNSALHGLFDFSLLTGTVVLVGQDAYVGSIAAILAYLVCAVLVLARRHKIEPIPA
jgi:hypothetical protein